MDEFAEGRGFAVEEAWGPGWDCTVVFDDEVVGGLEWEKLDRLRDNLAASEGITEVLHEDREVFTSKSTIWTSPRLGRRSPRRSSRPASAIVVSSRRDSRRPSSTSRSPGGRYPRGSAASRSYVAPEGVVETARSRGRRVSPGLSTDIGMGPTR